jgi:hypothetical protein
MTPMSETAILERLGLSACEALGCPSPYRLHANENGCVFELTDGSVVKITRKREEAVLAQVARSGEVSEWSEITPVIHEVYELKDDQDLPVFVIHREDVFDVTREDDDVEEWMDAWEEIRWTFEGCARAPEVSDDEGPFSLFQVQAAKATNKGFKLWDITLENLGYGGRGMVIRDFGECSLPASLSARRETSFSNLPEPVSSPAL